MKRPIQIRPEAEAEIEEAFRWYEEKLSGLGSDFLKFLENGMKRIADGPEMYPVVYRNVRDILYCFGKSHNHIGGLSWPP